MAVRIKISSRALTDLGRIRDYLVARSPQGADNVRRAVNSTIRLLADFPLAGRERPELGVRSIPVARFPYIIYYQMIGDVVWIVHVRDARRRPLESGEI